MSLADKNRNDILVAAGEAVITRYRAELDRERPEDICECGDCRRDHPDDGPCNLNGLGHGIPSGEPDAKCLKFRLSLGPETAVAPDASGADGAEREGENEPIACQKREM